MTLNDDNDVEKREGLDNRATSTQALSSLLKRLELSFGEDRFLVYEGQLTLEAEQHLRIPIAISLGPMQNGHAVILTGSIMLDGDGGPYVYYGYLSLRTGKFHLRYYRTPVTIPTGSDELPAADFAIECDITTAGKLSGSVISSQRGFVGSVDARQREELSSLPERRGYQGRWNGHTIEPGGEETPCSIVLFNGGTTAENPATLEFAFTPPKVGGFTLRETTATASAVVIDYLSQRVEFQYRDQEGNLSSITQFKFSKKQTQITGGTANVQTGRSIKFSAFKQEH